MHACSGVVGVASRTDGQVMVLLCAECSAGQAPALKIDTFDPSCSHDFLFTNVRYLSCYMHCLSQCVHITVSVIITASHVQQWHVVQSQGTSKKMQTMQLQVSLGDMTQPAAASDSQADRGSNNGNSNSSHPTSDQQELVSSPSINAVPSDLVSVSCELLYTRQ